MSDTAIKTIENEIYFFGEVTEETALELNVLLRKMERYSHIVIYIHSTGGDPYAAFSVMDHIKSLRIPVYTVADGLCGSAATLILMAGTKRYMKPHARVLIHQASSTSEVAKCTDLEDETRHIQGLVKMMSDTYLEHTKIPKKKLKLFMKRDIYLSLDQCLTYEIVHDVFCHRI